MTMQRRDMLLLATLAAAIATPVSAQNAPAAPDFSGVWRHPSLPGFEPLAAGPTSVTNKTRRPDGASDWNMLVGDSSNPILKPQAAEAVKKHGDLSLSGIMPPTPANQCWPQPVPYIFWTFNMQMVQQADKVTILYSNPDHEVRRVRMNQPHPAKVTPSWYGDSVGHYEGDTLVIDTVGIKKGPFAMLDMYGTPYTEKLHVVERYRLVDYDEAKDAIDRNAKENSLAGGAWGFDPDYRGKVLQLHFTVEDEGVFTTPWTSTITYRPAENPWPELICAENTFEYYNNRDSRIPTAAKPDF